MDLYTSTSERVTETITLNYSTSFGSASRLFKVSVRNHISNIYAVVRIADEIVDSYRGSDSGKLLSSYEEQVYAALKRGYSTDMVIHAFTQTARQFKIDRALIEPFFASMRTDISPPKKFSTEAYHAYIHGSAEVIGLMCLRVFCNGDPVQYDGLSSGAAALGSAFQKVNFLRDLADDTSRLGRHYFPDTSGVLNEHDKKNIIDDISKDLAAAHEALIRLPNSSRTAVMVAYKYYSVLLRKLSAASIEDIYTARLRVPNSRKFLILIITVLSSRLTRRLSDV